MASHGIFTDIDHLRGYAVFTARVVLELLNTIFSGEERLSALDVSEPLKRLTDQILKIALNVEMGFTPQGFVEGWVEITSKARTAFTADDIRLQWQTDSAVRAVK